MALTWIGRLQQHFELANAGLPDGTLIPVAGDFDLASRVTGVVRVLAPRDYRPELPDIDREALFELEEIQKRVSAAQFQGARDRFASGQNAIESHIATAILDEEGRINAFDHVTAFFNALDVVSR